MREKFAASQIALHWLTFILIVTAYATMELRFLAQRGSLTGVIMIVTHLSCGATVLVLMLTRLFLRQRYRDPGIVPPPPFWQLWMAKMMHTLIYLLFITLPILGLSGRYLDGRDWMLFAIPMPVADPPDEDLAELFFDWHQTLAPLGYWLIGLHAAAALFHHYLLKDSTLLRMLPGKARHSKR